MNPITAFESYLNQQNEESWAAALATLLRSIHEVDRNATQVWFAFYPLSLHGALRNAEDREQLARKLLLQGDYELKTQIDASHHFLYGHRFWPQVKQAVEARAEKGVGGGVLGVAEEGVGSRVSGVTNNFEQSSISSSKARGCDKTHQHPTPNTPHPTPWFLAG